MPRCKHTHEYYERVNLSTVRSAILRKEVFRGSNIYSRWIYDEDPRNPPTCTPTRYVVYSYGSHFPMYVWDGATEKWYGNSDKYSPSTTRHQSACRPPNVENWFPTSALQSIATFGIVGHLALKIESDKAKAVNYDTPPSCRVIYTI